MPEICQYPFDLRSNSDFLQTPKYHQVHEKASKSGHQVSFFRPLRQEKAPFLSQLEGQNRRHKRLRISYIPENQVYIMLGFDEL